MASLMYGSGLRLMESAELRIKDVNFDRGELTIRDGKGGKDRVTMLPVAMKGRLVDHFTRVKALQRRAIRFVIASRLTCSKAGTTSGRSRSCSGIGT